AAGTAAPASSYTCRTPAPGADPARTLHPQAPPPALPPDGPDRRLSMYKLLLVDDEPIIREGLEQMIDWEKLDLKLTASCANAITALDSMMDDMPDILLTDIRLPGMSGLELVSRAVA